jgi:stress response protein SCP2
MDTVTKHVGWIADDKDTREGHFDTPVNNVHQRKLQAKVEGIVMQDGMHRRQTATQVHVDKGMK